MLSLKKSISHITSSTDPFYNARIIKDEKEIKMKDLNAFDIEQAIKIIAGSARWLR